MSEADLQRIYPDGLPDFMTEYCGDLQRATPLTLVPYERKPETSPDWRFCRVFSIGMFKSTITCEAFPLWLIGGHPSISIILAVLAKDKGDRFITAAKSHLETNQMYRWLYGDLADSPGVWRADAIEVDRPLTRSAPTLEICGYQGAIEGERYDIGAADDLVSPENCRTKDARTKLENWVDGPLAGRLNPNTRMLMVIGTPHNADDLYARKKKAAEESGTWDYKEIPVIQRGTWPPKRKNPDQPYSKDNVIVPDDLDLAWPEWWTADKLVDEWLDNPLMFARQRLLKVRDPESKFFKQKLLDDCKADGGQRSDGSLKPALSRWPVQIGVPEPGSALYEMYKSAGFKVDQFKRVISVDLAATNPNETATSDPDWTVVHLWAVCPATGARIILNQSRRKTNSPSKIENILQEWVGAYDPHALVVEANSVEKLYARKLQDVIGFPVKIRELKKQKQVDIESFRDLVESGLVWIPYLNDSYKTKFVFDSFLEELHAWPDGAHDDTLAAAVHAYSQLKATSGARATVIGGQEQMGKMAEFEKEGEPVFPQEDNGPSAGALQLSPGSDNRRDRKKMREQLLGGRIRRDRDVR